MRRAQGFHPRPQERIFRRNRIWRNSQGRERLGEGFSLTELLVTLAVMSIAVIGALSFFDVATRLAKTQVNMSEIQSAQRIVHQEMARVLGMAGVGGLPDGINPQRANTSGTGTFGVFPTGLGLSVQNNVAAGTNLGTSTDPILVVPGTDILTLRGVFSTPVYYIEPQVPLVLDGSGKISITLNADVDLGVGQNLDDLREALESTDSEAFVVYDRYNPGAYAVLEYVASDSTLGAAGSSTMTIGLSLDGGTTYSEEFAKLAMGTTLETGSGGAEHAIPGTGVVIPMPRLVGAVGLLEEFRFFIRQDREIPNVATSRVTASLTRARFFPNTNQLHTEGALELAGNIIDLQVSLAVDQVPLDGQILEDPVDPGSDEILYNSPDDTDSLTNILGSAWANPNARLLFVRLSTLAQADRPDRDYPGALIDIVEDHDYNDSTLPASIFNTGSYIKLRKRLLQTIVQVRNLP